MNAWMALTKKELRLGFPVFIFALIMEIGLVLGSYYIGRTFGFEKEMILSASVVILLIHSLFLFFYMIYSLSYERKRLHLWLHNPMPIAGLLTSKLVSGLVFMSITFFSFLIFSLLFFQNNFEFFNEQTLFNISITSVVGIYFTALSAAIIFIFFWSIYLTLGKWMHEFFSFILTIILFILVMTGYEYVIHSPLMINLTQWGAIEVEDIFADFEFMISSEQFGVQANWDSVLFYTGEYIVDAIAIILLFIAACWIIDRKVEV